MAKEMDGLGCIGKLMMNFIPGLIAALKRGILCIGPEANEVKVPAMRIVFLL